MFEICVTAPSSNARRNIPRSIYIPFHNHITPCTCKLLVYNNGSKPYIIFNYINLFNSIADAINNYIGNFFRINSLFNKIVLLIAAKQSCPLNVC
ncbi:hypothetical protein Glove_11g43 [Diversispora epigaea]|uniref:Uncharacterized protein n=1 Tax=Diversispora epigaea TaxID=1348612 RepID=A0A397JZ78_9GLOM|nr:hypothetical protein Glove_11g43 [Diversispora epigaea]